MNGELSAQFDVIDAFPGLPPAAKDSLKSVIAINYLRGFVAGREQAEKDAAREAAAGQERLF